MELNPFQNPVSSEASALRGILSVLYTTQNPLKAIKSTCHLNGLQIHLLWGWILMWPLCSGSRARGDSWEAAQALTGELVILHFKATHCYIKRQFHTGAAASQTELCQAWLATAGTHWCSKSIHFQVFQSSGVHDGSFFQQIHLIWAVELACWALDWYGDKFLAKANSQIHPTSRCRCTLSPPRSSPPSLQPFDSFLPMAGILVQFNT